MRSIARRAGLGLAALLAAGHAASGALNSGALATRYADFKKQQTKKWSLTTTLGSITGLLGLGGTLTLVDRAVRYQVRLTTGGINPTNSPAFGSDFDDRQGHLDDQIGICAAHVTSTGHDVIVAVLDSGFNLNHPAIAARVLPYGFDPVGHDWNPQDRGNGIDDDHDGRTDAGVGHGTFVSGLVLQTAPEAWILPVRIADDEGLGLEEELVAGIDFAIAMGADVINLSYEAGTLNLAIRDKLHEARNAGIVVVVSAGNDASEAVKTMAEDGTTISVGAVDDDDAVAPFSNTPSDGRGITLFAPGVDLYGPHGGPTNDANCTWSGTSFSAPIVTGAVALVLQLDPSLTPVQVRDRLRVASTTPVTAWNGSVYPFAGRIDLPSAVNP